MADYTDYQCVVIIFLTYTKSLGKLCVMDGEIGEREIIEYFMGKKCPQLFGKPKVFIFQASTGLRVPRSTLNRYTSIDAGQFINLAYTLPIEADIVVLRSQFEAGPIHLPNKEGSWYIKTLCNRLGSLSKKTSILDIILKSCHDVVQNYNETSTKDEIQKRGNRLTPELSSTLTKNLYFGPSCGNNNREYSQERMHEPSHINTQEVEIDKYILGGTVFIFNNTEVIDEYRVIHSRVGTQYDVDSLKKSFESRGFTVKIFNDLDRDGMTNELNNTAPDLANDSSAVVIVLTHSVDGKLGTKKYPCSEDELIDCFKSYNCEILNGKPKLFLFQVCRGTEIKGEAKPSSYLNCPTNYNQDISGQSRVAIDAVPMTTTEKESQKRIYLDDDDILIVHSTYDDTYSIRNENGTWFIQSFCKELDKYPKDIQVPLLQVLTDTQRRIAMTKKAIFTRRLELPDGQLRDIDTVHKQMPIVFSTLTKNVYI